MEIEIIAAIFSVTFETKGKFLVVFVRLILGKVGLDRVTGRQQEIDIKHEFDFKVVLRGLWCKLRFVQTFFIELPRNN